MADNVKAAGEVTASPAAGTASAHQHRDTSGDQNLPELADDGNPNLKAALRYAGQGDPVLPLWWIADDGHCACGKADDERGHKPGKHPLGELVTNGVHDASTDPDLITSWWTQFPNANIGVAMRDKFVIDTDKKKNKQGIVVDGGELLFALEQRCGLLPSTRTAISGSGVGKHRYFHHPGGVTGSANRLGEHIDVVGNGGYVVAPPSNHISGGAYEWINPFIEIAAAPAWLIDLLGGDPADYDELERREATKDEVLRMTRKCEFVLHCKAHPTEIDGGLWTDLAGNLAMLGAAGADAFHGLSKLDQARYQQRETQRRLDRAKGPARCTTIAKHGWRCPRMGDDGKCSLKGGGMSPVVLAGKKKRQAFGDDKADALAQVLKQAQLWRTDTDGAYATIERDGHKQHMRIKSTAFVEWMQWRLLRGFGTTAGKETLNAARDLAHALAINEGPIHQVWRRVGRHDGKIYVDLGDDSWSAVEIDSGGWRISQQPPIRFHRSGNMKPLPLPIEGGSFLDMRSLVNVKDERDWRLIVAILVGAFLPEGPFLIVVLLGVAGASKSTLLEFLRSLIDPAKATRRGPPRTEEDLIVQASHNWACSFDNVSHIEAELADAYCRLATGGGIGKRQLWTDGDEFVMEVKRPLLMTAINLPTQRQDFIDRSAIITLAPIDEAARLTEREVTARFEAARGKVLGAIFAAVSMALRRVDEVRSLKVPLPRMADFAQWIEAAGPALGWPIDRDNGRTTFFIEEFAEAVRGTLGNVARDDAFSAAIIDWINKAGDQRGTAAQLADGLREYLAARDEAGKRLVEGERWPNTGGKFQRALDRSVGGLEANGIGYASEPQPRRNDGKVYTLSLKGREPAASADNFNY